MSMYPQYLLALTCEILKAGSLQSNHAIIIENDETTILNTHNFDQEILV